MLRDAKQSQETCRNVAAAFERPRKGVQAAVGICFPEIVPSLPVMFARQEVTGFLHFEKRIWSALPKRSGDSALDCALSLWVTVRVRVLARAVLPSPLPCPKGRGREKRRRTALAAKLQIFILALIPLVLCSCSNGAYTSNSSSATREVTDEAGRRFTVPEKIDRIVSLAPNLTEIVYAIGAGDRLVGDTTYCDYPEAAKSVEKVGDTIKPSIERIIALKPQIVLVSTASQLEAFTNQLEQQHIAVYVTNPKDLEEVFQSILYLGVLFGNSDQAEKLIHDLQARAMAIENAVKGAKRVTVFFQLADQPLYTIGRDAFQTDLIRSAGGISVTKDLPTAFPTFSDEAALASKPDAIILPVSTRDNGNSTVAPALKNSPAVLHNRVYKISEDHLSRPGPRLVDGLEEMARDLHPEAFK